jgi:RNA polymerase sigma-70 factor (ECF subfamily)
LELLSDEQLVALTREGDVTAFNSLATRWESSLYGFVRRTVGNPDDARDVCQEALTKAYVNIRRLREGSKFKAWIHHIAFNICRDRFRARRAEAETRAFDEEDATSLDVPAHVRIAAAADHGAATTSLHGVLGAVLARVPVEQRTAILLREYHGFTSEEIAEITGVPAATVRTRIYYGLKLVRRLLRQRGIGASDFL